MMPANQTERVAVWDPLVRVGHWALVAAFALTYLSAEEEGADVPDLLHVWGGYAVGIIVAVRVLWGFLGPDNARFSEFVRGPVVALRYLVSLLRGQARRYLGHSPAGGFMVLALLVCLAATVGTGLVAYGERGMGPLRGIGEPLAGPNPLAQVDEKGNSRPAASSRTHERTESTLAQLHGTLANITLALVILHILGVALASVVHRENLVAAMITGEKRSGD